MVCTWARLCIVLGIVLIGKIGQVDGLTTTKYPPGHSSYTTTAENVFLAATTGQPISSSSSQFSLSAFQPSLSSSSFADLLQSPPPSPLTGDTTVPFSVTVNGTTAFCQLSFSTDFVCISSAEVSCQMARADGAVPHMGQVEHAWDTITRIDGVAYDITALLTFNPTSQTIATLVICSSSTCAYSSSSSGVRDTCMDYPRLCGSSSSSSSSSPSSSSPIHSPFKYISSSYVSIYSSSSSSSSSFSSSSSSGEGLPFIFGSSPSESSSSSSACSITYFAWSSGSGVEIAWPSIVSSSSYVSASTISSSSSKIYTTPTTTTTTFTTPGGVTNSKGSVIT